MNPLERQFLATSQAAAQRRAAEREARRQRELKAARQVAEAERQRAQEQARASTRLRRLAGALAVVFLLAVAAAAFAMNQQRVAQTTADTLAAEVVVRSTAQAQAVAAQETAVAEGNRAERQARLALSCQLAAQSLNLADAHIDLALLLSLEAYRATDTVEARGSLLNALEHNPQLTTFLRGHTDAVWSVAFSPGGKTLASGSSDNTIILWDVTTRQPIGQPLTGHADRVKSLVFSPDGRILASAGCRSLDPSQPNTRVCTQGEIRLWDTSTMLSAGVTTRQPLGQPLTGHTNEVMSVAFSPDGKKLASGGLDNTVIVWDLDFDSWRARACRIANRNFARAEWKWYPGDEPYRKTCPGLP